MMTYYNLSIPFQSLIQLGLFLEFCFGSYIMWTLSDRKKTFTKVMVVVGMIISGALLIIYTAEARADLRKLEIPPISDWLCGKPVIFTVIIFAGILALFIHYFFQEREYRKNTITRASIQEGVDKISSGICFFSKDGRIILSNERMHNLCFEIVGRDLQNGDLFWKILSGGETLPQAKRLEYGDHPSFRMDNGVIWTFGREMIDGIYQLTAADTTQIHMITDELKRKNKELSALNHRLRKYGENVDELTRSKERLETKSHIHRELGQALLSTRRFLLDEDNSQSPPLDLWEQNVAMLRKEANLKADELPMDMLTRIAAATGINIDIKGDEIKDAEVQRLFAQAAAEALTNAIGHAQASTLFIEQSEREYVYYVRFTNDGNQPMKEIVEGGGLTSLRKKIENEAGTMEITSMPKFMLEVTLPKERRDRYDTSFTC